MDSPTQYNPADPAWSYEQWFAMYLDLGLGRTEARLAAAGAVGDLDDLHSQSEEAGVSETSPSRSPLREGMKPPAPPRPPASS